MQPQGDNPDDFYQDQRTCRTGCPFGDVRLTVPTGYPPGQLHTYLQQGIIFQGPGGVSAAESTSWVYYPSAPSVQAYPPVFPPWDAGPLDRRDEPETLLSEGSIEPFPSDVGGSSNTAVTVDYGDSFRGGVWLDGDFPRYDANAGSPTHLTTSTSTASSQVSHSRLVQEVCCC